jgi:ABC-type antimicrobial peptide transport system permease subunit
MLGYALKRLVRGKSLFLALFLSVTLAVTLFSGILQGADAVGASILSTALEATDVDFVSSAEDRNLTKTSLTEVEEAIASLEHVVRVEHLIRSVEQEARAGIEVVVSGSNESMPFTIVAIASDSNLVSGLSGLERLEPGMVYVDVASINATLFSEGDSLTLQVPTYVPGGSLVDIQNRFFDVQVGGVVEVDDRLFSIAMGRYALFLRSLFVGLGKTDRRPPHKLMFMSEETFLGWMNQIYGEKRRHTRVLIAETIIGLDRESLLNPWDIADSKRQVKLVYEKVNGLGARFGYIPQNYLGSLLDVVDLSSSQMRTNTMLLAAPVFFTAWYLGATVSDISLSQRRREIGLLFTRGFTHAQVFYIFLFEALFVGLLAGASGILLGAWIVPLVLPGMSGLQVILSSSPAVVIISFIFSCVLALFAAYRPAKRAISLNIVDALKEYQGGEEEAIGSWHEPALALILGLYRVVMLILGLTVEQFRPPTANLIVFIVYSTWWGVDFILTYTAPVLLFWGFTKLVVQYSPLLQSVLGRLGRVLVGDTAYFLSLDIRRNAKRVAASTFMAALIVGYSIFIIGAVSSANDYTERFTRLTIGADASVWLFDMENADATNTKIAGLKGVASATVETWFEAQSSLGVIPVRIIDPKEWGNIAYIEEGWLEGANVFEKMEGVKTNVIMEKGAASFIGATIGSNVLIKLGDQVHTFTVVGLFGRDPGPGWAPQNPTLYIPNTYEINDKYLELSRILVEFEEGADILGFKESVETLHPDVEGVDVAEAIIQGSLNNIFITGPGRVQKLGVYFAALVSSLGVAMVVSTALGIRWKELTVMAIRGYSNGQLRSALFIESMGLTLFSIVLGLGVGIIMLHGEIVVFNAVHSAVLQRRIAFPPSAQMTLVIIIGLLVISTATPIILAVRRVYENLTWIVQE